MATRPDCGPGGDDDDLKGYHKCPEGDGAPDFSWFFRNPGRPLPGSKNADPAREPEISRGFNFGVILLPYTRDWGIKLGPMRRKKAYPTILHSFARKADRAYAMASAEHFIPKKDKFKQPIAEFLITAKPFAGWTWEARPLQRWLALAQIEADKHGGRRSLNALAAGDAAVAWCTGSARQWWEILTIETFPYSPSDLIDYYLTRGDPPLPGAVPLPADLEPEAGGDGAP